MPITTKHGSMLDNSPQPSKSARSSRTTPHGCGAVAMSDVDGWKFRCHNLALKVDRFGLVWSAQRVSAMCELRVMDRLVSTLPSIRECMDMQELTARLWAGESK